MINLKNYQMLWHEKLEKKITFAQYNSNYFYSQLVDMAKTIFNNRYLFPSCFFLVFLFLSTTLIAQDKRFTVVIDAGHGGHDPGAMGMMSREKDINLSVSLDLGELIGKNYKDVKVIFTRQTDRYLTLQERADVVNNNHADLFMCIHTNASPSSSAYGAETFTLGLAKSKGNLDVAMRENSVILLEDDYRTKYKGFDPSSVDSYIMFEFMQDKYIDKSLDMASIIQKQFVNFCSRSDRGVRQAGFWVLHRSACPSVLVELGFISNPSEERYLSSNQGQTEMAKALYNAFVIYKREHDKKSGHHGVSAPPMEQVKPVVETSKSETIITKPVAALPVKETVVPSTKKSEAKEPVKETLAEDKKAQAPKVASVSNSAPVFKVQIFASVSTLKENAPDLKGVKDTEHFAEGGLNKYTVGAETDYSKIEKVRLGLLKKFPKAFIIAFVGDKKISVNEARRLAK